MCLIAHDESDFACAHDIIDFLGFFDLIYLEHIMFTG